MFLFQKCFSSIVPSQAKVNNAFVVLFSVLYTSKLQEANATEIPVVNSTKQLMCSTDKPGFPEEIKAVRWYKDGEQINDGEKYEINGT